LHPDEVNVSSFATLFLFLLFCYEKRDDIEMKKITKE